MNNELLLVAFRTIVILIILFILTKLMGKKQVGQMNIYDYLVGITIGSIAADISLDIEKNIIAGILSLLIYGLSSILITFLTLKSLTLRKIFTGTPTILIDQGKILAKNLRQEGIDINNLQEEARQQGYFNLNQINYAILETNGSISFLPTFENQNINKKDMNIKKQETYLCTNIIIDGTLLENNLNNMNKDKNWLDKILKKKGYNNYDNILLLTLDKNNNLTIYNKNESHNINTYKQ